MNFSEDWKSYFPISPSHAPLLVSDFERSTLGPLIFNPNPQTPTQLFSSSSLLPPPIHTPKQSLSRFLETATSDFAILPSTASSIASLFGSQLEDDLPSALRYNRLEILKYGNNVFLFFPTGENFDRVGFLMLYLEGSNLRVKLDANDDIFQVSFGASHRILRILVNPISDGNGSSSIVGYLLVSTRYAVYWFSICYDSHLERPHVIHKCSQTFKTYSVAHACWSPHIFEESLILLESGDLFLFDLMYGIKDAANFKGSRLKVKWPTSSCSKDLVWVSCDFSWNPRIFIVAASHAVFLVDCTKDALVVSCLLTVDILPMHAQAQNEQFLALSRAGPDNFYFTVVSNNFLLLCDVRKQMMPVIRWAHDLDNPTYINVLNLFQLRSHYRKDAFESASKSGFCIILGSFFNGNFNIFCYGSSLLCKEGSFASKSSNTNKTFHVWELPYELAISGYNCRCGSCLLKEELSKEGLPKWIDWQTKKDMVLGFSILNSDFASLLCKQDKYGGFTLARLMSSGKLEIQRYQASWVTDKKLKDCNGQGVPLNRYLFSVGDEKYKFPKTFVYLKSNYLYSYFRGNLTEHLVETLEGMDVRKKKSLDMEVHQALCTKLNACGVGLSRSSATIAFFKDVNPSASLYEVALRGLWAKLPLHILQLAFSKHVADQKKVSLEFLTVPPHNKLPPFFLRKSSPPRKKCSKKVRCNDGISGKKKCNDDISGEKSCNDDIVGPILPLSVLLVLHKIGYRSSDLKDPKFSVETEVNLQCKEVMKLAGKISVSALGSELFDNLAVSHDDDDAKETWVDPSRPKPFVLYRPILFECPATDRLHGDFIDQYKIHHTLAFNVLENNTVSNEKSESVGQGISDYASSVKPRSDAPVEKFGPCDLKAYNAVKIHMSRWKEDFGSYKKFCIQTKMQKAINK